MHPPPVAKLKSRMPEQIFVFAFEAQESQRLDKYLVTCLPEFSRARLQDLIKQGYVTLDGKAVLRPGFVLEKPAQVQVVAPVAAPTQMLAEDIPLQIVFENDDMMVVDKPAGMVVHPALGHYTGTLVNAALAHSPEIEGVGGEQRPGVVHRLDKDTSGLILLAKNDHAHQWLQEQFRSREAKKTYLALVDGKPPTPTGRIEAAIGRSSTHRSQMAIVPLAKGRESISEYSTLESFERHTLLEVHPYTGRTHQIRLHLAFIHCPVAGDTVYGYKHSTIPLDRHFLHAARLTIRLTDEETPRTFETPLPPALLQLLANLRL